MPDETTSPGQPNIARRKRMSLSKILLLSSIAIVALVIFLILFIPAYQSERYSTRKFYDGHNLRSVAMALLEYEKNYHQFPPAYTVDGSGNKLHSWRTLVLPYLGESELFEHIDMSKPWDAPENKKFHSKDIAAFGFHSADLKPGETLCRAVVHPRGIFTGPHPTDGSSVTDKKVVLVVDAGVAQSTNWMRPEEFTVADFLQVNDSSPYYMGQTNIGFADGSVAHESPQKIGLHGLESLVIIDDGGLAQQ